MARDIIRQKYNVHKAQAKHRGIDFELSFDQWLSIWNASGQLENRGKKIGQYVMSRKNDIGPYSVNNVFIQQTSANIRDAVIGNKYATGKQSIETCKKKSLAKLGKSRIFTEEHKANISKGMNRKYHT